MSKIFGFDEAPDNLFEPPAIVVPAPGPRMPVRRPQRVVQQAQKANAMIKAYREHGPVAAHALADARDLRNRSATPVITLSDERFAQELDKIGRQEHDPRLVPTASEDYARVSARLGHPWMVDLHKPDGERVTTLELPEGDLPDEVTFQDVRFRLMLRATVGYPTEPNTPIYEQVWEAG